MLFEKPDPKIREESLWAAILCQAVQDLRYQGGNSEGLYWKYEAEHWFNIHNKDFCMVCENAGYHPQWVLDRLEKIKAREWRAKAGDGKRFMERFWYRKGIRKVTSMSETLRKVIVAERERCLRELSHLDKMLVLLDQAGLNNMTVDTQKHTGTTTITEIVGGQPWTVTERKPPQRGLSNEHREQIRAGVISGKGPAEIAKEIGEPYMRVYPVYVKMKNSMEPDHG